MNNADFFTFLLIGHLCGEFLFQTERMMTSKWRNSFRGLLTCAEHSAIYTAIVIFFLCTFAGATLTPYLIGLLFVSHFIIDKFLLAVHWMTWFKDMKAPLAMKLASDISKQPEMEHNALQAYVHKFQNELVLDEDTFLGSIFYTVEYYLIDNLMHLLPVFFLAKYYYGF